jgi:O-antigen ligase
MCFFVSITLEYGNFSLIERFDDLYDYESLARYAGYLDAISVFQNNFLIGAGPSGYFRLTGRQYPHNLILEVLSEYGIFGGFFLLIILLLSLQIVFKEFRNSNIFIRIIKLLWFYFFLNTMTSGYISSNREFWILSGILVVIYNFNKKIYMLNVYEK